MPNYFALIRIEDKNKPSEEQHYVPLQTVDEEICKALGKSVHPTEYYMGWYDSIGLRLALGQTFEQIEKEYEKYLESSADHKEVTYMQNMLNIIRFMKEHYVSNSWARIGKE